MPSAALVSLTLTQTQGSGKRIVGSTLPTPVARRGGRELEGVVPPPWAGARAEELVPASPGVASRSRPDFIFAVSSKRPHRGTDLLSTPTPSTATAFVGVSPAAGPEPAKENVLVAVCIWLPARARTRKAVLGFLLTSFLFVASAVPRGAWELQTGAWSSDGGQLREEAADTCWPLRRHLNVLCRVQCC